MFSMFVCVGKEAEFDDNDTDRVGLSEFCLYWPSCSVMAEFVTHMSRNAFVIEIL